MKRKPIKPKVKRGGFRQAIPAVMLMGMVALAIAGPSGIVAWSDNQKLLDQRKAQLAQLSADRDALKNRVELLDPNHPDPDFAGELARKSLNVVGRDDKVMMIQH